MIYVHIIIERPTQRGLTETDGDVSATANTVPAALTQIDGWTLSASITLIGSGTGPRRATQKIFPPAKWLFTLRNSLIAGTLNTLSTLTVANLNHTKSGSGSIGSHRQQPEGARLQTENAADEILQQNEKWPSLNEP